MQYPRILILAAVVVVVAALYFAQTVLVPVALAIFLSFVLSPLVTRLERFHLGRPTSVVVVALVAFAAIGSLGWVVGRQAVDLVTRLPEYRERLDAKLAILRETVRGPLEQASDVVRQLEDSATGHAGGDRDPGARARIPAGAATYAPASRFPEAGTSGTARLLDWASSSFGTLLSLLATAASVVLLVFIMLVQRGDLRDRFISLAGGGLVVTTQALDEAGRRLSRYLLVLTLINAGYGAAVGIGLRLIGVENCVLWAILAATLRFVPYVGPWIAASMPILFSFAISEGFTTPIVTCALFLMLELVTNMVVEPMVFTRGIGVSTTALVVSAVFWTWLWGPVGLVLATPLTVCVAVMGSHIPRMRFLSVLLGDHSVLSPALRMYQRLLVGESEDAWNLVAAELRGGKSTVEVYDSLLLPALCLAQQDRRERVIDEATLVKVAERTLELAEELGDRAQPTEPAIVLRNPLRVVCVAAEKESDAAASSMLCALLRRAGADAIEAPRGGLVSEALGVIRSADAGAVCVSQIPPLSFTRLRYVCKRVAEHFPGTPILVGTWTMNLDPSRVQERLESGGELQVAGSLAEMLQQVERIAALARSNTAPAPMIEPAPAPA